MYDKKTDDELFKSRQFPKLSLGAIFYFSLYARKTQNYFDPIGKSFRAFAKDDDDRSHRVLVKIVNRIEYQMQRLLIERTYRGQDGQMYRAGDYAEAVEVKAKRIGELTKYGRAWWMMAEHIRDLYDIMIHVEDEAALRDAIKEQQELLSRQRLDIYSRPRKKEDFDGL